jgi:hypothetical protein
MNTFKHIATLTLFLAAAGCSGNQTPQPAVFVPPAESSSDFGDLRVHYNALPTASLGDAVARDYDVQKDPGTGMMVVALRRLSDGNEVATQGDVTAVVLDLQGVRQQVDFRAVKTGDYTDHLGTFEMSPRNTYRFEVTVKSDGRTEVVKFQRSF